MIGDKLVPMSVSLTPASGQAASPVQVSSPVQISTPMTGQLPSGATMSISVGSPLSYPAGEDGQGDEAVNPSDDFASEQKEATSGG